MKCSHFTRKKYACLNSFRSYVAELLNSGLSDAYTIEIDVAPEAENAMLECDARLISRAINNPLCRTASNITRRLRNSA